VQRREIGWSLGVTAGSYLGERRRPRSAGLLAPLIAGALSLSTLARSAEDRASPRWFVGEKVVCVNNRFLDLADAPELVEGDVYTIKTVLPPRRGHFGIEVDEVEAERAFAAFDERRFAIVDSFTEDSPHAGAWSRPLTARLSKR
jgi:hypothetical protein